MKLGRRKKTLLVIFMGGLLLVVLLILARPLYLPDAFLIRQIERRVSSAAGIRLEIESGRIRLLRGAMLRGLNLRDSTGQDIASIGELRFRYHLLPLLQRRIVIEDLTIVDPVFHLALQAEVIPDSAQKAAPVSAISPAIPGGAPLSAEEPGGLPFQFDLPLPLTIRHLEIQNAEIHLSREGPDGRLEARFNGLNLQGQQIFLKSAEDFHAELNLRQDETLDVSWQRGDLTIQANSPMGLSVDAQIQPSYTSLDLSLTLQPELDVLSGPEQPKQIILPAIGFTCKATLERNQDLRIDPMQLALDGEPALKASARLTDLLRRRYLDLQIEEGKLDLNKLWALLGDASSLLGIESLTRGRTLSGRLHLLESNLNGTLGEPQLDLRTSLHWALEDGSFQDLNANLDVSGLDLNAFIEGRPFPITNPSFDFGADIQIQSLNLPDQIGRPWEMSPLSFHLAASLQPDWGAPGLQVNWRGRSASTGELEGNFELNAEKLNRQNLLASPGLHLEGGGTVDGLSLEAFILERASGTLTAAFDIKAAGFDDIEIYVGTLSPEVRIHLPERVVSIPLLRMRLEGQGSLSSNLNQLDVRNLKIDVPPYFDADLSGTLGTNLRWALRNARLSADAGEILPLIKPLLPAHLQGINGWGKVVFSGSADGGLGLSQLNLRPEVRITSPDLSLSLPHLGLELDSISLQTSLSGDLRAVDVSGQMAVVSLTASTLRAASYRNMSASWEGTFNIAGGETRGSLWIKSPDLGFDAEVQGQLATSGAYPAGDGRARFQFNSADSVELIRDLTCVGSAQVEVDLSLSADSTLRMQGGLTGQNLSLKYSHDLAATGLAFDIPFEAMVRMDSTRLSFPRLPDQPLAPGDPMLFAAAEHLFPPQKGTGRLCAGRLRFSDYEISDLDGLLSFRQGRLAAPRFTLNAYGGALQGAFWVDVPELNPDSISYQIRFSTQGVNTARFPGTRAEEGEQGEISAFGHFSGQGIDPGGYFNLNGGLDITRIGRQVADNLLRFLDPDQTDPSIQTYRRYLKRGWGVKVFSFEVKDDFVYVSIAPAKPPISKLDMFIPSRFVGLGKSITFGRLPLRFFLSSPGTANP